MSEDEFNRRLEERRLRITQALDCGDEDRRPQRHLMSPREAWDEIIGILRLRETLMRWGWLPPREQDMRERRGREDGTLFEGDPIKWALNRTYSMEDIPPGAQRAFTE